MTIKFYDVSIEAVRDATQDDFDRLWSGNEQKHEDIAELQALLNEHGIELPAGMKPRRSVKADSHWRDVQKPNDA
jgi:hypothetical protein